MRIFRNFPEALGEIRRDLSEMGIRVHPQTYQDKFVADNPGFATKEVTNYLYSVVEPMASELHPTKPWVDAEFTERMNGAYGEPVNPGEAWKLRAEIWNEFLQPDGTFAYSYGERFGRSKQVIQIIDRLRTDPDSRQCFLGIWDAEEDINKLGGISRVPCSLGYLFQIRRGRMDMTYLQRSSDFATHFVNDVYLAHLLQEWVAIKVGVPVGHFTHWLGSLHVFEKDIQGVF